MRILLELGLLLLELLGQKLGLDDGVGVLAGFNPAVEAVVPAEVGAELGDGGEVGEYNVGLGLADHEGLLCLVDGVVDRKDVLDEDTRVDPA